MLPVARLEDLGRLRDVSDEQLVAFIRASLASVEKGVLPDAESDTLRIIQVLSFLFVEASKLKCSETDFRDSLVSFPLSQSAKDLLLRPKTLFYEHIFLSENTHVWKA